MKAMMSERLRNILNDPNSARELQKQLSAPKSSHKAEKQETTYDRKSSLRDQLNAPKNKY